MPTGSKRGAVHSGGSDAEPGGGGTKGTVHGMADRSAGRAATGVRALRDEATEASSGGNGSYVLPVVHVRVPDAVVNLGFWGALGGSAMVGLIDPPLAVLVGAGVIVARHQSRH
jgi:hypothetical protein